jgi:flavodoxin
MLSNSSKYLVIYFSVTGQTLRIANLIKQKTNGDIKKIETGNSYTGCCRFCSAICHALCCGKPKVSNDFVNFTEYDLIFVGSPTWARKLPNAVSMFLDQCDFQGKTVMTFATAGSNLGDIFQDFKNHIHNGNVIKGKGFIDIAKVSDEELDQMVSEMLNDL